MKQTDPKHPFQNKHYEGPINGGEGKENLKIQSNYEFMGVHRSAPNPKPSVVKGATQGRDGTEEGRTFHAFDKSYAGPQRIAMKPTGVVVRNPDDLER